MHIRETRRETVVEKVYFSKLLLCKVLYSLGVGQLLGKLQLKHRFFGKISTCPPLN
jgi:hypothetical protein